MAVNGSVFTIATPNEETFTSLCGQLKELLKAGDADFENLCVSKNIPALCKKTFCPSHSCCKWH